MRARWGFDLNDPAAADRAWEAAARAPADPDSLLLAAAVRSSRGDDPGALDAARQAVAADPLSGRAHTSLAALLARSGQSPEALAHAERAVELQPDDPVALYNRGIARWLAGDRAAARDFDTASDALGIGRARWPFGRRAR